MLFPANLLASTTSAAEWQHTTYRDTVADAAAEEKRSSSSSTSNWGGFTFSGCNNSACTFTSTTIMLNTMDLGKQSTTRNLANTISCVGINHMFCNSHFLYGAVNQLGAFTSVEQNWARLNWTHSSQFSTWSEPIHLCCGHVNGPWSSVLYTKFQPSHSVDNTAVLLHQHIITDRGSRQTHQGLEALASIGN